MVSAKRQLFTTPSSSKRAKTAAALTNDVAKLTRQFNISRPEIRQKSYVVEVPPGPPTGTGVATPLLIPSFILGEEFRLHRIHVSHQVIGEKVNAWGLLYSPKQGFSQDSDLALPNTAYGQENYEFIQDQSKQRVWVRAQEGDPRKSQRVTTGGINRVNFFEMDKKFSIPMKCTTATPNQTDPTVTGNQVYYGGSHRFEGEGAPLRVTIWFTDS